MIVWQFFVGVLFGIGMLVLGAIAAVLLWLIGTDYDPDQEYDEDFHSWG